MEIQIDQFQENCRTLIANLDDLKDSVIITQNGKPVAQLLPIVHPKETAPLFGAMKGTLIENGDLLAPIDETWEANE